MEKTSTSSSAGNDALIFRYCTCSYCCFFLLLWASHELPTWLPSYRIKFTLDMCGEWTCWVPFASIDRFSSLPVWKIWFFYELLHSHEIVLSGKGIINTYPDRNRWCNKGAPNLIFFASERAMNHKVNRLRKNKWDRLWTSFLTLFGTYSRTMESSIMSNQGALTMGSDFCNRMDMNRSMIHEVNR